MRQVFREYHHLNNNEINAIWADALFVFDTNTLLNMYRYSRSTASEYVDVLKELKKKSQLWLPYYVAYEFYESRLTVINEYNDSYDNLLGILDKFKKEIDQKYRDHPILDIDRLKAEIDESLAGVEKNIKTAQRRHPKWLKSDDVLDDLAQVFEGLIGPKYPSKKMKSLCEEADKRYAAKIPPGYMDEKKPDQRKYGDYIIWRQIIEQAKSTKKPVIFVSGDVKEDWWLKNHGEKIMPRPELRREMLDEANVDFHIYTADRFLELYKERAGGVESGAIKEVRKIRELEETRAREMFEERRLVRKERRLHTLAQLLDAIHDIEMIIANAHFHPQSRELLARRVVEIREQIRRLMSHGGGGELDFRKLNIMVEEMSFQIERAIELDHFPGNVRDDIIRVLSRLTSLNHSVLHRGYLS